MRTCIASFVLLVVATRGVRAADAQIPRGDSLRYVPLPRAITAHTEASQYFRLFGDRDARSYRDEEPADRNDDATAAREDARLLQLLTGLDPRRTDARSRAPEANDERVLFLDLPGYDERSWRAYYSRLDRGTSAIYAHPFVAHDQRDGDSAYTLVLQYWFFYPFNDGANTHEGDWEHLNVGVTTLAAAQRAQQGGARRSRGAR